MNRYGQPRGQQNSEKSAKLRILPEQPEGPAVPCFPAEQQIQPRQQHRKAGRKFQQSVIIKKKRMHRTSAAR